MAKTNKEGTAKKKGSAYVVKEFRSKDNFDMVHEVGDDVSDFEQSRIDDLVSKGLVEIEGADAPADDKNPPA